MCFFSSCSWDAICIYCIQVMGTEAGIHGCRGRLFRATLKYYSKTELHEKSLFLSSSQRSPMMGLQPFCNTWLTHTVEKKWLFLTSKRSRNETDIKNKTCQGIHFEWLIILTSKPIMNMWSQLRGICCQIYTIWYSEGVAIE